MDTDLFVGFITALGESLEVSREVGNMPPTEFELHAIASRIVVTEPLVEATAIVWTPERAANLAKAIAHLNEKNKHLFHKATARAKEIAEELQKGPSASIMEPFT